MEKFRENLNPWLKKLPRFMIIVIVILLIPIHLVIYVSIYAYDAMKEVFTQHFDVIKEVWKGD